MPDVTPPEDAGFSANAVRYADKAAFVLGDQVRTYAELDDRGTRLARWYDAHHLRAPDRIALMLPNSIEMFDAWMGAAKLGLPVVLINWHLKADELAYILEDSGAKLLVSHHELEPQLRAALARVPDVRLLVVGGTGDEDFEAAVAAGTPELSDVEIEPIEGLAAPVFYTSGTTGRPKGVVHDSFAGERARQGQSGQVQLWGWTVDDVNIMSGPGYHAGPSGYAMAALWVGATTVILPRFDARAWLAAVDEHGVTISFMVPAHFIRILEVPDDERETYDVSSLRLLVHGGAPCPEHVKRRAIEVLAPGEIWELYGASEGGATRISPEEWLRKPGSVGTPWPGVQIRILDDDGNEVATGERGRVFVRPAMDMRFSYHEDAQKTDDAWRDGFFTVGDVGYVDEDGYLFLTDRATDMVIRGGVNVYPREIEDVLYTHPAVVDCAVFGVPDERLGEQLKAVVEVRSTTTPDELRDYLRERLADYKVPAYVELVDELPRQPNGKVFKRLLREQHWAGRDVKIG